MPPIKQITQKLVTEAPKPKQADRPADWQKELKSQVEAALQGQPAIELMWTWNELVMEGCSSVSQDMTLTAHSAVAGTTRSLQDGLKATMQRLAKAQSEGDFGPTTAPRYLLGAFTQLLVDQLEHPKRIFDIASHGAWLNENPPGATPVDFAGKMNGLLLTSELGNGTAIYAPGTVFRVKDAKGFGRAFGKEVYELLEEWIGHNKQKHQVWLKDACPILIELSPVCDLAQGNRVSAMLVAGFVAPKSYAADVNRKGEAWGRIANFFLRWPVDDFAPQEIELGYCNRYKITLTASSLADWLEPWFRLRELPTASIRNSNAAHAARLGFASL